MWWTREWKSGDTKFVYASEGDFVVVGTNVDDVLEIER